MPRSGEDVCTGFGAHRSASIAVHDAIGARACARLVWLGSACKWCSSTNLCGTFGGRTSVPPCSEWTHRPTAATGIVTGALTATDPVGANLSDTAAVIGLSSTMNPRCGQCEVTQVLSGRTCRPNTLCGRHSGPACRTWCGG